MLLDRNLQALIENWSSKIGHWQLNSASSTAQWPFIGSQLPSRSRFQSAPSIVFDPRLVIRSCFCAVPWSFRRPALPVAEAGCGARSASGDLAAKRAGARRPAPPTSRRRFPAAGSGKSPRRGLQHVKEQARERHRRATLTYLDGTARTIVNFFRRMSAVRLRRADLGEPEGEGSEPKNGGLTATKEHKEPSAASRNQRKATTDFTDATDKKRRVLHP